MASLRIEAPFLWAAGIIWPPVCTAIVAARFATRRAQGNRIGVDDWLTVPALILVLGMAATILVGTAQGSLGYPTPKPPPGGAMTASSFVQTVARKAFFTITLLQLSCLAFIKLSCMMFYRRVFRTVKGSFVDITIHIINGLITIWALGFFFSWAFGCGLNFDYFWTTLENQLKCPVDLSMIDLSLSISDVIMDVIVLLFPVPLVLRLQMTARRKAAVLGIFILGAIAIAASAARLTVVVQELNAEFAANADEDFVSTDALYFMYIEACFGLCAVCLPSLAGAFKLRGVQTLMDGFTSIFSSRDSSRVSRNEVTQRTRRYSPSSVGSVSLDPKATHYSNSAGASLDLEMNPPPLDNFITVTRQFDQSSQI